MVLAAVVAREMYVSWLSLFIYLFIFLRHMEFFCADKHCNLNADCAFYTWTTRVVHSAVYINFDVALRAIDRGIFTK